MSEYIDVYRIEKNGRGPFQYHEHLMNSSLPCPRQDADLPEMKESEIEKYRFGAPSRESLVEWTDCPSELDQKGYRVSLYKAKKKYTHSSEIQTMFIKRHAKKIKDWSVEEFCAGNI